MNKIATIRRYKYLPFDDGSLQVLASGTIKFTKPSECNDPFDCDPEHESDNVEEFLENRPDLVEKVAKFLNLNPCQKLQEKPLMADRLRTALNNGLFGQPASDNIGICSLSRDPLNLLMWSHYSKDHTGFVVEFEIPIESYELPNDEVSLFKLLIPREVKYRKEKPIVLFTDDNDMKVEKQFLVKSIDWAYEQEERVVDDIRKSGIHEYDQKNILYSVIAGMKMAEPKYRKLNEIVQLINTTKDLNVFLHKAEPVQGQFQLFVKDRPDLKSKKNII